MSLSPAEAAKHVGLTKQSVIKAIRSGRLSAIKDASGGWSIEPVELFRVWPAVNQDRGRVTPKVDAGLPPENNEVVAALKGQIELLRSQLDDVRVDRNHWRQIAERSLLTDQRSASERLQQDTPHPMAAFGPACSAGLRRMNTMNDWVLARTRSGEQQAWLAGFDESDPVWVASADEAVAYDREGAEAARLRCTDLPDHDDVLYAVCHLAAGETAPLSASRQPPKGLSPSTEAWLQSALDAGNRADRDPKFAEEVGKRVP
ncbi:hypothetical protein RirG_004620 [Rhizophagus irregularis DAOM 197198w]|uniref:Helix-turn-helix domain-containing protein n=1 Tax=Rhizophagus irregularis (strain DAOM 197198w) TaxID=1432141 RepID=A0A015KIS7_RHIIW|nr:hypothetical protein RirG_004530 [Rhizophagus irregularis DAOM 197198w]EXX79544.1 hypothetical protein RirG_004620 [Rhizophagus irregularis DAOM 197198w]